MGDELLGGAPLAPRVGKLTADAWRIVATTETQQELFESVCQLLVERAGYAFAWVGLTRDDPEPAVVSVASVGVSCPTCNPVGWVDEPCAEGPLDRAMRTRAPVVVCDAVAVPADSLGRDAPGGCRQNGCVAFPLSVTGDVVGALFVHAQGEAFDTEEIQRLGEVASALSAGVARAREAQEREHAVRELRLAHAKLAAVYAASPDMIFLHAGDGRILEVNPATESFIGLTAAEICELPPDRLMGEAHSFEEAQAHVRRALEHGADDFAWVGRKADGTTYPCEVRLRRLPGERDTIAEPHIVAITRDLTEFTRLQDELVGVQRLESLAVLAGGIAHDFNNLLAGIIGNVELARLDGRISPQSNELLEQAGDAALRARGLTRQLLAFARGGDGEPLRFDLGELLQEVATFVFAGASIEHRLTISDEPIFVTSDREQLAQVIDNLLRNALEASTAGGKVFIELSRTRDLRTATLEVRDEGQGVDPTIASRIFEPFFTTKKTGSGLGLSSAFGITRRAGGQLELRPATGCGATFALTLPITHAGPGDIGDAHDVSVLERSTPTDLRRALVLDDLAGLRELFSHMLERAGFDVVDCADGDEALARCREAKRAGRPFALALLDLTIPGGRGGHEICGELREIDPRTLVVAVTGYAVADARAADFDGFLAKPFGVAALEAELARLFPNE